MKIRTITGREIIKSIAIAIVVFIVLGTITAVWENAYFMRMTPSTSLDMVILVLESILLGFYFGTENVVTGCDYSKQATVGGVFGFLGFGCLVCNKVLLLLFGSTFLLSFIEPIRYYIGFAGIIIMGYFLYKKLHIVDAHAVV